MAGILAQRDDYGERPLHLVTGLNLDRIYHHLCLSRQRFIRIGTNEDDDGDVPSQDGPR